MEIRILQEEGYHQALFGIGLSYGITSGKSCFNFDDLKRLEDVALKLCHLDGGENKFLRQMTVILDLNMPLYW